MPPSDISTTVERIGRNVFPAFAKVGTDPLSWHTSRGRLAEMDNRKIIHGLIAGIVVSVLSIGGASGQDPLEPATPPLTEWPGPFNSPTWEQTVDNGDGTFTFSQVVNNQSTPPHYTGPWYSGGWYGFGFYSWWDQDYGWLHTFPDYALAGLDILFATLTVRAWDVDSEVWRGWEGEFDGVTGDGNWLDPQYLQGTNGTWSVTVMNVDPSALMDGLLNIWLNIDMHHTYDNWATTLDYSRLDLTYTFSGNNPPYQPTLSISPVGCTYSTDDLVVTVTGPTPADPDGDPVAYEYRWLVDTGTGFYVDDEFAGRGDHTGNTVPSADTQIGDRWKVEVKAVDPYGAKSTANTVSFATIGDCNTPPIADAGSDRTSCTTEVTLDGSASYDPDGTIDTYLWEVYLSGSWVALGSSAVVTHDFGALGVYQVRLTVTDNHGATDSANAYIAVEACNLPPVADPGGPYVGAEGSPLSFDGTGSSDPDGDPLTYSWDFGDGYMGAGPTPSHVYANDGTYTVCLTVDDGELADQECTTAVIANVAPVVTVSGPTPLNEGDTATYSATVVDPGLLDTHAILWDCDGDGFDDGSGTTVVCMFADGPAIVPVRAQATDDAADSGVGQLDVEVFNVDPAVGPLAVTPTLAEVGTPIEVSADFTDPGLLDTHVVVIDWGDGPPDPAQPTTSPAQGTHVYSEAGVYEIVLTVIDKDGGQGQSIYQYVVIFDPGAGFVTGGGWIISAAGNYRPDPNLAGQATFGFVSRYLRGATVPVGETEFWFHAGDMNFHSTSYEWLVVTQDATYAQYRGEGAINGEGTYRFMLWAGDHDPDSPDTFRIKIWEEDEFGNQTVIYDNGVDQPLDEGTIIIHHSWKS